MQLNITMQIVFMDVDEFHNIDENKTIEFLKIKLRAITEPTKKKKKRISAIIVVHMWGGQGSKLYDLVKKYNIEIIEDAAEALGSKYIKGKFKNKFAGTIGNAALFMIKL